MPVVGHPRIKSRSLASRPTWPGAPADAMAALGISRGELVTMSNAIQGTIAIPGSPSYAAASQGNPLYPASPRIIVACRVFEDVRLALGWAHDHDWWVTLRSGGHSTAGFSLNDGMVIDVSGISGIVIDPIAKLAHVGAGATWGPVNSMLDSFGLHVPGGGCPTVGVAGYMQGGGYGFTSREFGMNCDNVVAATVMKADGTRLVASATENKDLFWAIRGGTGGNFGVLLDVTYQLVALRAMWGFALKWPIAAGPDALVALQSQLMGAAGDTKVGYQLAITTLSDGPGVVMMGMYDGSRDDGLKAIAGLRKIGNPALVLDRSSTYAQLNEGLIDVLPGIPEAPGETTYEIKRCGYIKQSLARSDWQDILDYYLTTPNPYNIVGIEPYGGAIAKPPLPNAFIHRDVSMDFFIDSFFREDWDYNGGDSAQRWIDGFMALMASRVTGRVYQNYPWRGLPDFEEAYWGDAIGKLRTVKQAVDPDGFFHFEQSIRGAAPGG